ncbi:MAG: response regulator transcription factor [Elusimicrobiota bacterium]
MATILIVDDEPDFRLILADIFTRAGFKTLEAPDGRQALDMLSAAHADLVVVDWNMPILSGPEFCTEIRQHHDFDTLPIIMLTVRQQNVDHAEGIHQGADLYLTKPVDSEILLTHVKSLLRRAQK